MRMINRALSLLLMLALAVPVLALPATALGQSAGDDQYVDPFQDEPNNQGNQGNSGSQGNGNDTPASEEPVAQAPDPGDTAGLTAAEDAADDGATLPRTGLPIAPIALIGVILLGAGLTLRRAWPLRD